MREPIKDRNRLEHILEAIDRILENTKGSTLDKLSSNDIFYFGIVKNIEIVGEAAYHLTKAFRDSHPETPWLAIMGMRHVLVHDYYQIDENEILYVIEDNLHPLREQIVKYLSETDWEKWEKSEQVIAETAVHKNLIQTARRMKNDGMSAESIMRYTGLNREEIEGI